MAGSCQWHYWPQGRNHDWKVEGTKVCVPTPGRLRPTTGQRPCWPLLAVPSRCEGTLVLARKIFQNSDAKSCILVATCCGISCFLKTAAKKLGDRYIFGQFGGPVSPGPYGCCAYNWLQPVSLQNAKLIPQGKMYFSNENNWPEVEIVTGNAKFRVGLFRFE